MDRTESSAARLRAYWREELALIALLLAFFLGIVLLATGIPFDARLFPLVIGSAGLLLVLAVGAGQWQRRRRGEIAAPDEAEAGGARLAIALCAAPVFGLLFWLVGFVVASLVAMLVLPPLLGYRDRKRLLPIAIVTVALLALIGPYLLNVDLPHGLVGDWLIERLSLRAS
jgi:hypothetical protein